VASCHYGPAKHVARQLLHAEAMLSLPRRTLIELAGLGATLALVPRELFAEEPAVNAFLGSFKHVGGSKEREARDKAIEDVVADMSFISRGIARDKLKQSNPVVQKLTMASDAKDLTVTMDGRAYKGPLDGSRVKVKTILGDEMDMQFKIKKAALDQIFSGDDKGRVNAFRFDGAKLIFNVRVHASALPKDLVYKLTYEKV
jgi:hypothetical protein